MKMHNIDLAAPEWVDHSPNRRTMNDQHNLRMDRKKYSDGQHSAFNIKDLNNGLFWALTIMFSGLTSDP